MNGEGVAGWKVDARGWYRCWVSLVRGLSVIIAMVSLLTLLPGWAAATAVPIELASDPIGSAFHLLCE